jgi:7,8-dihydropterin-6-yl-methyl-4-(beta-D-ribofuranosyl)aminobenzene 5'-phosphate synthase
MQTGSGSRQLLRRPVSLVALAIITGWSGCRASERSPSAQSSRPHDAAHGKQAKASRPSTAPGAAQPEAPDASKAEAGKQPSDSAEPWVRLTVVVDTLPGLAGLQRAWGLAVLIQDHDDTVLFDTGPDPQVLSHNLRHLGVDLHQIDALVLSHIHHDHVGGIDALLRADTRPAVFILPSFPTSFRRVVRQHATEVVATPGRRVGSNILSTGELTGPPGEQAVIISTTSGLVLVTGCSHPNVVRFVERARELAGPRVRLVLGGFHLAHATEAKLGRIVRDLRKLGVEQVAPCHCTGSRAISRLRAEYGAACLTVRLGEPLVVNTAAAVAQPR